MDLPIFSARGLTKVYRSGEVEVYALRGVDLDLAEGEIAVLLGPSGSGKSTLLNIMGGLDTPTSGTMRFRDEELTRFSERQLTAYRRDHVGFVFQFYNLIPSLTAWENVALVTEISARPMKPEEALEMVGLKDRLHHFPAQLSGGEQQRVAIARALAPDPKILIADEPTGNLDQATGRQVADLLFAKASERGMTLVLVTHDPALAHRCSRQIAMRSGRIESGQIRAVPA